MPRYNDEQMRAALLIMKATPYRGNALEIIPAIFKIAKKCQKLAEIKCERELTPIELKKADQLMGTLCQYGEALDLDLRMSWDPRSGGVVVMVPCPLVGATDLTRPLAIFG